MDLILLLFAAGLVLAFLLWPDVKEYRHARRRRAIRREVEAARASTTHGDPGRVAVSADGARVGTVVGRGTGTAGGPMLCVRAPHPGLVVGGQDPERHIPRLQAFREELAARGQYLDDSRIENR